MAIYPFSLGKIYTSWPTYPVEFNTSRQYRALHALLFATIYVLSILAVEVPYMILTVGFSIGLCCALHALLSATIYIPSILAVGAPYMILTVGFSIGLDDNLTLGDSCPHYT